MFLVSRQRGIVSWTVIYFVLMLIIFKELFNLVLELMKFVACHLSVVLNYSDRYELHSFNVIASAYFYASYVRLVLLLSQQLIALQDLEVFNW